MLFHWHCTCRLRLFWLHLRPSSGQTRWLREVGTASFRRRPKGFSPWKILKIHDSTHLGPLILTFWGFRHFDIILFYLWKKESFSLIIFFWTKTEFLPLIVTGKIVLDGNSKYPNPNRKYSSSFTFHILQGNERAK